MADLQNEGWVVWSSRNGSPDPAHCLKGSGGPSQFGELVHWHPLWRLGMLVYPTREEAQAIADYCNKQDDITGWKVRRALITFPEENA